VINWAVVGQVDKTSQLGRRGGGASLSQVIVKLCLQQDSVARVYIATDAYLYRTQVN